MSKGNKKATVAVVTPEGERVRKRRKGTPPTALLLAGLLVTATAAVVAVSARSWLTPRTPTAKEASIVSVAERRNESPPPPPQQQQEQLPADVTLTTFNTTGFSPTEITHEAGRFRIVVQNKSALSDLDLRLDSEPTSRWTEQHALGEIQGWVATVELGAGTYLISDARRPELVCHLTVQ